MPHFAKTDLHLGHLLHSLSLTIDWLLVDHLGPNVACWLHYPVERVLDQAAASEGRDKLGVLQLHTVERNDHL